MYNSYRHCSSFHSAACKTYLSNSHAQLSLFLSGIVRSSSFTFSRRFYVAQRCKTNGPCVFFFAQCRRQLMAVINKRSVLSNLHTKLDISYGQAILFSLNGLLVGEDGPSVIIIYWVLVKNNILNVVFVLHCLCTHWCYNQKSSIGLRHTFSNNWDFTLSLSICLQSTKIRQKSRWITLVSIQCV